MSTVDTWVAGVDGCPGGWLVALRRAASGEVRLRLCRTFREVLDLEEVPAIIAVDMPIGLPDRAGPGGRTCDVEARRHLGARQSSVFGVPARDAVMETDYARACEIAFALSDPPRRVSKQCFHLFPRIREIDGLVSPALQERVVECHPELAFWALNGNQPMSLPKKVKSRPNPSGLDQRRRLLADHGFPEAMHEWPKALVGPDDVLDACVLSWSAGRLQAGQAVRLPEDPPRDRRGLRMEICA